MFDNLLLLLFITKSREKKKKSWKSGKHVCQNTRES